jgi:hypothetical protein
LKSERNLGTISAWYISFKRDILLMPPVYF